MSFLCTKVHRSAHYRPALRIITSVNTRGYCIAHTLLKHHLLIMKDSRQGKFSTLTDAAGFARSAAREHEVQRLSNMPRSSMDPICASKETFLLAKSRSFQLPDDDDLHRSVNRHPLTERGLKPQEKSYQVRLESRRKTSRRNRGLIIAWRHLMQPRDSVASRNSAEALVTWYADTDLKSIQDAHN